MVMVSNFPDELRNDKLREYELSGSDCISFRMFLPPNLTFFLQDANFKFAPDITITSMRFIAF